MSLPRFCKICRLILHYPDLKREDYDEAQDFFKGIGYCPEKHYEIHLKEKDDSVTIIREKLCYNEYTIVLSHNEGIFYLSKEDILVYARPVTEIQDINFRDKEYMLYKLDTLVNFS